MQKKKRKKSEETMFWQDPDHSVQGILHRRMGKNFILTFKKVIYPKRETPATKNKKQREKNAFIL